jgi:hypothetical protein
VCVSQFVSWKTHTTVVVLDAMMSLGHFHAFISFFFFLPFLTSLPLSFAVIYRLLAFVWNQPFHFHSFQEVHVLQHRNTWAQPSTTVKCCISHSEHNQAQQWSVVYLTANVRSVTLQTAALLRNGRTVVIQAVKIKFVESTK